MKANCARVTLALGCFGMVLTMAFAQAPAVLVIPQNPDPTQQVLTINFRNQLVNTQSAAQTVTLWNISSTQVTNLTASVTTPFAISSNLSATTLQPGQSATVKVKFFAQGTAGSTYTGSLKFTGSATGLIPIPSVALTGTTASTSSSPKPSAVSPAYDFHGIAGSNGGTLDGSLYFGNQSVGVTTCAAKVYLSNGTGATVTATASLSGSSAFMLTNPTSVSVPSGMNTAAVGVTYTPSAMVNDTSTLTINFGSAGTQTVAINGSGVNPGQNPVPYPFIDMGNSRSYQAGSSLFAGGLFDGNFGPSVDTGCNSPSAYVTASNPSGATDDTVGRAFAALMQPINASGQYDTAGNIVLLSLGMSNASDEWCGVGSDMGNNGVDNLCGSPSYSGASPSVYSFMQQASMKSGLNKSLVIVNGAISSQEACDYTLWSTSQSLPSFCTAIPTGAGGAARVDYDAILSDQLTPHSPRLYESQVQAIWLKEADVAIVQQMSKSNIGSLGCASCTPDAYNLESNLANIVRAAKHRYPNLRIVFLTSRSFGAFTGFLPTEEPYAYEGGFANKWLVKAQIDQMNNGGCVTDTHAQDLNYLYTPSATCGSSGGPEAPWVVWDRLPSTQSLAGSSYIWAYTPGINQTPDANSDGAIWPYDGANPSSCTPPNTNSYFKDGQHPNDCGINQVGGKLLLNYFLTSPYTNPWFSSH